MTLTYKDVSRAVKKLSLDLRNEAQANIWLDLNDPDRSSFLLRMGFVNGVYRGR